MIDRTGIFSTKFDKLVWLFKQGLYGTEHILADVDAWADYIKRGNKSELFRVETVCGKFLKYNTTFSVVRNKDGRVTNICLDCVMGYESKEKGEAALQKDTPAQANRKRYGDDPF